MFQTTFVRLIVIVAVEWGKCLDLPLLLYRTCVCVRWKRGLVFKQYTHTHTHTVVIRNKTREQDRRKGARRTKKKAVREHHFGWRSKGVFCHHHHYSMQQSHHSFSCCRFIVKTNRPDADKPATNQVTPSKRLHQVSRTIGNESGSRPTKTVAQRFQARRTRCNRFWPEAKY